MLRARGRRGKEGLRCYDAPMLRKEGEEGNRISKFGGTHNLLTAKKVAISSVTSSSGRFFYRPDGGVTDIYINDPLPLQFEIKTSDLTSLHT